MDQKKTIPKYVKIQQNSDVSVPNNDLLEHRCPYANVSRNSDSLVFAGKVCQHHAIRSRELEEKGLSLLTVLSWAAGRLTSRPESRRV